MMMHILKPNEQCKRIEKRKTSIVLSYGKNFHGLAKILRKILASQQYLINFLLELYPCQG